MAGGYPHPAVLFKTIFWLIGVFIVCVILVVVNPNGIRLYTYPFETLTSPSMQQFIQEWASPDFHQIEWQPLAWLILALLGSGLLGKKSISVTEILLILVFGYAALRSMRNVPLFAIAAAPILASEVDSIYHIKLEITENKRPIHWLAPILLVCALLITGLRLISIDQQQSKTEKEDFPAAAVNWILQNQPKGNIFNTYGWGGYLIWRLYPNYRVYIDGRADVYGDRFIYDYINVYLAQSDWEKALSSNNIKIVLVEPGSGLAGALKNSPDWEISYQDKNSDLFIKK